MTIKSPVYIVVLEDRHTDVQLFGYSNFEDAKKKADELIADYNYTPEEVFEYKYTDEFLFAAPLSSEDDHLSIRRVLVEITPFRGIDYP